jgi:tyrosyl-tRNA synthetase
MQVADVFHLKVKICQLGMDQRKANVVAREVGEKIGCWKPVCVHHHLLQGLEKPTVWPIPEGQEKEAIASAKMSKSKPETCIFIYDTPAEIKQKMSKAFCPEKTVRFNPIMDICKYIIFREKPAFNIERPEKFGGSIQFGSFEELSTAYIEGKLHPMDLKCGVADELGKILEPVRRYFEVHKGAAECLETIRKAKVTR